MREKEKRLEFNIFAALVLLFIGGALLSLNVGATEGFDEQIFWLLRVPRTICAIAVGGGLAVAGTLIQASLGNPLADPYTIGIASAAALGAVLGSLLKSHQFLGAGVSAFIFSLAALVFLGFWLRKSFRHSTEVLLAGVIVGFFFTSLATLVMALADPAAWTSTFTWLMGAFGPLSLSEASATLALMCIATVIGWLHWKPLDLLSVDELSAESVGLNIGAFRRRVFILVALMTAVCVSVAGVIGFVGLIVPHTLRRLGLRRHFTLIPASFLGGAALIACSDVAARVVARPSELPVGVVMALMGAPFFLMIARKQER
ncbi:MAG: iron ABC transporter permease [Bdellovibrionota bacterium]